MPLKACLLSEKVDFGSGGVPDKSTRTAGHGELATHMPS